MKSILNPFRIMTLTLAVSGAIASGTSAFAADNGHGGDHGPNTDHHGHREFDPTKRTPRPLQPSGRYSGSTPIDLKHGIPFNNGTYGLRNPAYEDWAATPVVVPGLSEKKYPYALKKQFVRGAEESVQFLQIAIWNWEQTSPDTKPEAVEYSKQSIATMTPLLNRLRDAVKAASSSGERDWEKNEEAARTALIEARATYRGLHKNVSRR